MDELEQFDSLPDYEIRACLASGGMAEVFLAQVLDGGLRGAEVILKRLHPRHREDRNYIDLFVVEAQLGEKIVHHNIAQTYELLHRGEDLFIVQEHVNDCLLRDLMRAGTTPIEALAVAFGDLARALAHLHGGKAVRSPGGSAIIIHRDVGPENVVVGTDGVAKLIDFGIAEMEGRPDSQRSGALAGTAAYMSPEQARGQVIDRRSDVFSAGIVLWEILQHASLFHHTTPFESLRAICEDEIPPLTKPDENVRNALEPVVRRALARDREERFPSGAELLSAFEAACVEAALTPDRSELARSVRHARSEHTGPQVRD